jgi:hypothetical protein
MHACINRLSIEHLPKPLVSIQTAPLPHPWIEVKDPFQESHNVLFWSTNEEVESIFIKEFAVPATALAIYAVLDSPGIYMSYLVHFFITP